MPIQFLSAVESTSLLQSPDVALLDATGVDPTPVSDALREILGASTHAKAIYDYVNGHDVAVRICACTSTSNFPDTVFDCKLDPPVIYFRTDVHVTYATTSSNWDTTASLNTTTCFATNTKSVMNSAYRDE